MNEGFLTSKLGRGIKINPWIHQGKPDATTISPHNLKRVYMHGMYAILKSYPFYHFKSKLKMYLIVSHLICALISENEGLEKSRSASNLRKISVPAHLIFFSVCHLNFFQIYGINFEKNSGVKLKKKSGVQELKFF